MSNREVLEPLVDALVQTSATRSPACEPLAPFMNVAQGAPQSGC
jgi:hypothetical protein